MKRVSSLVYILRERPLKEIIRQSHWDFGKVNKPKPLQFISGLYFSVKLCWSCADVPSDSVMHGEFPSVYCISNTWGVYVLETVLYTVRDTVPLCQSPLFYSFSHIFMSADFTQYLQWTRNKTPVTLKIFLSSNLCATMRSGFFFFPPSKCYVAQGFVGSINIMLMVNTIFILFGIMGNS